MLMKILLDTHISIWSVLDSEELSDTAGALILDEKNEIYYSTASIWEITIRHMAHSENAPPHKDPFNRLMFAQAKSEEMKFMTHDTFISYYNEPFIIRV